MRRADAAVRWCPSVAVARLYKPDLVTRHTGRAVRLSIEGMLAEYRGHVLTVLDFREVTIIDFSCADEVVAKLVLDSEARPAHDRFFLFRGIAEHHLDPVQSVLGRRRLTVAVERLEGGRSLVGWVAAEERRAWEALCRAGRSGAGPVSEEIGMSEGPARELLDGLYRRHLLLRMGAEYVSLFRALAEAGARGSA